MPSLNMNNPDANSIEADQDSIFVDATNHNYQLTVNSLAHSLLPNGHNAGVYQQGNEIIGLLPGHKNPGNATVPKQPKPPTGVRVTSD